MRHVQQCELWNMSLMDSLERQFGHTKTTLLSSQTSLNTISEISVMVVRDYRTTKSEHQPPNATSLLISYLC